MNKKSYKFIVSSTKLKFKTRDSQKSRFFSRSRLGKKFVVSVFKKKSRLISEKQEISGNFNQDSADKFEPNSFKAFLN